MLGRAWYWLKTRFRAESAALTPPASPFRENRSQFMTRENPRSRAAVSAWRSQGLDLDLDEVYEEVEDLADPDVRNMSSPLGVPYAILPGQNRIKREGDKWIIVHDPKFEPETPTDG